MIVRATSQVLQARLFFGGVLLHLLLSVANIEGHSTTTQGPRQNFCTHIQGMVAGGMYSQLCLVCYMPVCKTWIFG
ncbi:hypothetical protein C8R41DRAFT_857280 [Lentinula lateritia]|uniref:Secreted protein n=1 Tax=Lentinula lateritia TaxID=40482 RepID=A0ABQ8V0D9_9AGAR|nr:hypothetical protein C8R41DRAFT_857280 [Lentinula lateritia]